ncbi:hypothetical protein CHZ52_24025 [Salmonella enterica]|jgi:hypothetical protein|nr:hypothetical protein [Salmonella enterica]EBH9217814.1 hypothetical protein [Salmonella enterica subsp. enterica serovar Ohio]ECH8482914.1 hypothetical protein [Salmonella enterica subsp. enterica serovar Senftenberg]ECU6764302.1 hypothetical protein [Salmonella enterica subsp. enterica serovar Havana]EHN4004349.1 hypothetical protein [Salmonella enterica subsp. enterica serovar Kentucky]MDG0223345.1 hypothetical protein [Salmonella enterica subsp. enterica]HAB5632231.1 hypothetical protei
MRINLATKALMVALTLGTVSTLGIWGSANAQGPINRYQGMTSEQQIAVDKVYIEYEKTMSSLQQQLIIKQAEFDALSYGQTSQNTEKAQSLIREIGELNAKLYATRSGMRSKLEASGGYYPDRGMMRGHHGRGMMNSDYYDSCW